jgi:acetyl esterase/lipase
VGVDPVITGRDPSANETVTGSAILYVNGNASLAVTDPLVSPLLADYATLFAGNALPPTLIQVGLRETLLSDAVLLYHKMKAAAPAPGRVVLSPYEGMWHVFQGYIQVPEAAAASREMADFFTRALAS